jgi:predicted N-acyltransferase
MARRRHAPMMVVDRLTSLREVPAREWNDLAGHASFYLSHQWLAAQDEGQPVDCAYHTARIGGRLVGALPTYVVKRETNEFYTPRRCADGRWTGQYLLAGARRAYTNDILVRADLAGADRDRVTAALVDAAVQRCAEEALDSALFLYLDTQAARRLTRCAGAASVPVFATADAVLDLPGTGFDDYLAALPYRRRDQVRRESTRFISAGFSIATFPVEQTWERLAELFGAVQRRYGQGGDAAAWRGLVERQSVRVAADAVILGCRRGGELVGAVLLYGWRDACYVKLVGFDYDRLEGAFEYFNLVYYAVIRYAYAQGLTRVHFGREAFEAKLRRGAQLRPLWIVEVPASVVAEVPDWNAREGRAWRERFGWASHAFGDQGWSMWDMS